MAVVSWVWKMWGYVWIPHFSINWVLAFVKSSVVKSMHYIYHVSYSIIVNKKKKMRDSYMVLGAIVMDVWELGMMMSLSLPMSQCIFKMSVRWLMSVQDGIIPHVYWSVGRSIRGDVEIVVSWGRAHWGTSASLRWSRFRHSGSVWRWYSVEVDIRW